MSPAPELEMGGRHGVGTCRPAEPAQDVGFYAAATGDADTDSSRGEEWVVEPVDRLSASTLKLS